MKRTMAGIAIAWLAVPTQLGCGARTMLGGGRDEDAALTADVGVDSSLDGGVVACVPIANPCAPWNDGSSCDAEHCQQWAQSLTAAGFAHVEVPSVSEICAMADKCFHDDVSGHMICQCANGTTDCKFDEVCVSDTPDGPTSCRPMCVPACAFSGCTPSLCICDNSLTPDVCATSGRACDSTTPACVSECPDAN